MRLSFFGSDPSRGMASALLLAASAAAIPLLAPTAAQAQLVIVNGYEIKTVTGEFATGNVNGIDLTQTPWWGSSTEAEDFARQVGGQLGFPNPPPNGGFGAPLFAYLPGNGVLVWSCDSTGCGEADVPTSTLVATWAYAVSPVPNTSVPAPLPVLGAAAAFGFSRKLRKRIKSAKLPVASVID